MLLGPQHMTKLTVDANTQTSRQETEGHFKGRQKLHKEKPNRGPWSTAAPGCSNERPEQDPTLHAPTAFRPDLV